MPNTSCLEKIEAFVLFVILRLRQFWQPILEEIDALLVILDVGEDVC